MQHSMFQSRTFAEGQYSVVGDCNGYTMQQRWDEETPVFARAIARHMPADCATALDYGCGVGRIAKELLELRDDVDILGVDASEFQLAHASKYVANPRFRPMLPHHLNRRVDFAYSIYVLQHVPAIDLRETIQRLHYYLREGGTLAYCSSDARMAIRFEPQGGFVDDRHLGVNLRDEIGRYFEPVGPLFEPEELERAPLVRAMVSGVRPDGIRVLAHPAIVFRRKTLRGVFGIPYLARRPDAESAVPNERLEARVPAADAR